MPKELLFSITRKDFEIQVFRCGGHGGQKVDKTSSGVRIIHKESGAVGESREERSQALNKRIAFRRLAESPKFKTWHNRKIHEVLTNMTIEQKVDKLMTLENLKIEVIENGKWTTLNDVNR
ncbi:MAG: peptide chain release factor-like protein [Candidatus Shapirobacteria bacterium]